MNKGLVSILIVTFNAEKYIENTILSCLKQTYPKTELLILDNDSADRTVQIIKSIDSEKIKLFLLKKNVGPFAGLNYLLNRAKGEYIAIQDHDDIWLPKKIEKQVKFLSDNNDFIACGTKTFYFYEEYKKFVLNKKKLLVDCFDHTSLVFRNFNFRYNEKHVLSDEHFQKKVLGKKGKIICLDDILTIHRIKKDNKNLSNIRFSLSLKSISDFFKLNRFGFKSLTYFIFIIASKLISTGLIYKIASIFFRKNLDQLSLDNFRIKYPDVKI